jgi:hypothetical protein
LLRREYHYEKITEFANNSHLCDLLGIKLRGKDKGQPLEPPAQKKK